MKLFFKSRWWEMLNQNMFANCEKSKDKENGEEIVYAQQK